MHVRTQASRANACARGYARSCSSAAYYSYEWVRYGIVGDIKSASAHKINKALKRRERVWLNEAFDRMPREEEFERYKEYIIMNPVRRGLVEKPDQYEWLWYE